MTAEMNFKEEIKKLAELQILDSEIYDLTSQKEVFPGRLKEMDDSLESKRTGLNAAEEALKQIQVTKNEKETDIKAKEEKAQKHDSELYQIKNNKEYKALQDEIASIKADISLLEEEVITLYDDIAAAQEKIEEEKKIFEEEGKAVEAEKETIRKEEKEIDARIGELTAKRDELTPTIDKDLLSKYERILKGRGRVALAEIEGDFCGACNMHLRPQLINEVKKQKALVVCENCGRMLYESQD